MLVPTVPWQVSRFALTCLILGGLGAASACARSDKQLTLSSTCAAYFELDHAARYDAAQRLSIAAHAQDAGNPMWEAQADSACGTLGGSAPLSRAFHTANDDAQTESETSTSDKA